MRWIANWHSQSIQTWTVDRLTGIFSPNDVSWIIWGTKRLLVFKCFLGDIAPGIPEIESAFRAELGALYVKAVRHVGKSEDTDVDMTAAASAMQVAFNPDLDDAQDMPDELMQINGAVDDDTLHLSYHIIRWYTSTKRSLQRA